MSEDSSRAVELRDYLDVLWRRKWIILITFAVVVIAGVFRSAGQTKIYRAAGEILVSVGDEDEILTQISILQGQAIRQKVAEKVPGAGGVTASAGVGRIVTVAVDSGDPKLAAEAVAAYISTYIEYRQEQRLQQLLDSTEQTRKRADDLKAQVDQLTEEYEAKTAEIDERAIPFDGESATEQVARAQTVARDRRELDVDLKSRRDAALRDQLQLESTLFQLESARDVTTPAAEIVNDPTVPTSPVRPDPVAAGIAAAVFGLTLGIALAFLFEYLDESLKTKEDIQRATGLKVPVVATIPAIPEWRDRTKTEVVSLSAPRSSAAEAYRSLRTTVQFAGLENPVNVIAITSPTAGEGKTTALANLAVVVAGAGRKVVMLDCDLRRPRIHSFFGMSNDIGFTSWIIGEVPLMSAVREVPGIRRLSLMASGPIPPNPSELLSSKRFTELVRTLQADGALVLIDTPPLLPVTDAAVIARSIDLAFMVTMAGKGTRKHLRQAMEILDQVDAPLGGIVLNGAEVDRRTYYEGSYYGETPSASPSLRRAPNTQIPRPAPSPPPRRPPSNRPPSNQPPRPLRPAAPAQSAPSAPPAPTVSAPLPPNPQPNPQAQQAPPPAASPPAPNGGSNGAADPTKRRTTQP